MHAPRLLIVDDDPALLDALSAMITFRLRAVAVETDDDPLHALERVRQSHYAAVISDCRMPKLNGLAFLDAVKGIRPCIPVLLSTGGDQRVLTEGLRRGAADILWKPIDRNDFVQAVRRALRLHHLQHRMDSIRARMHTIRLLIHHIPGRRHELGLQPSTSGDRLRRRSERLEGQLTRLNTRSRLLAAATQSRLLQRTHLPMSEEAS